MSQKKPQDEIWYVHAPLSNEKRPIVQAVQPSNIPYLNGIMDTDEDLNKKSTVWFRSTDSDFVKLSKLGGREDLLIHRVKENSKEPVGYPRPVWWTDMLTGVEEDNTDEEKSDLIVHMKVPAWFAHQNKVNNPVNRDLNFSPSSSNDVKISPTQFYKKVEAIEEPRKYGQLRNFLNPSVIKKTPELDFVNYKGKKIENATSMPKLMANFYQEDRPKDFQEWKSKQNSMKGSKKSVALR